MTPPTDTAPPLTSLSLTPSSSEITAIPRSSHRRASTQSRSTCSNRCRRTSERVVERFRSARRDSSQLFGAASVLLSLRVPFVRRESSRSARRCINGPLPETETEMQPFVWDRYASSSFTDRLKFDVWFSSSSTTPKMAPASSCDAMPYQEMCILSYYRHAVSRALEVDR